MDETLDRLGAAGPTTRVPGRRAPDDAPLEVRVDGPGGAGTTR